MYKTIVVGTDGSETAKKAVGEAADLANRVGASMHLVSAYQAIPESRLKAERRETPAEYQYMINPREEVESVLGEAADDAKSAGVDQVETHALETDPADALIDVAEEQNADLVIVGNRGMTGGKRFLLGSVPNKVSHHAPCSVMIVKTT